MKLFTENQLKLAEQIADLNFTNPFLPERVTLEKNILGKDYEDIGIVWNAGSAQEVYLANISKIDNIAKTILNDIQPILTKNASKITKKEYYLYEDLLAYFLYNKYLPYFHDIIIYKKSPSFQFYNQFLKDSKHYLQPSKVNIPPQYAPDHLFALYYQVHRAFYYIFDYIVGSSMAIAKLRAAIWQSIFTHDIRRYQRCLYNKMNDITTLITGPSGTGKELVAQAISLSSYIPFNSKKLEFLGNYLEQFTPLQLSAMSQNLIESELFGHKKGAYTGALNDRSGWLEQCSEFGTVFLDEIGEINEELQVKLLRVLQTRSFQRLGDSAFCNFKGKIIAATNRNLTEEITEGQFRSDLYYRLCADIICTPTLKEQLSDSEEIINIYISFLAKKIVGTEEAESLTKEAGTWIKRNLGHHYDWPGNVRELEQCVRNILIRGSYSPALSNIPGTKDSLSTKIANGSLTADELLAEYCSIIYSQTGSYVETAAKLQIDRRTVKKYTDMQK